MNLSGTYTALAVRTHATLRQQPETRASESTEAQMYYLLKKDGIRIRSNTISLLGIPTQDDVFSFVSMALSVVSSIPSGFPDSHVVRCST